MDQTQKLQIINEEPNFQMRLKLLVDHGFLKEASQFIRGLAHTRTALFYYEWDGIPLCSPLSRVTKQRSTVYVIITSGSKLEYQPQNDDEQHIIFELGWERQVLGWSEGESRELVRAIMAHALVRPLNQWFLRQAEGTARASRLLLPTDDPMAREVAALHLVYHLRRADFLDICGYLVEIEGFPFIGPIGSPSRKKFDAEVLMNWIVTELLRLGWTSEHICKELVEWLWLKTDTCAEWLLAVAKVSFLSNSSPVRATAIRRWLMQGFDYLLDTVSTWEDKESATEAYRQLFRIGQLGAEDEGWISAKLVERMAAGKVVCVNWFFGQIGQALKFNNYSRIQERAIEAATKAGNYGIAVGLKYYAHEVPDRAWVDIANLRGLSTKIH